MRYITGMFMLAGNISWQGVGPGNVREDSGITIQFPLHNHLSHREAIRLVRTTLERNEVEWLRNIGQDWILDFDTLKTWVSGRLDNEIWMRGVANVRPEVEHYQETIFENINQMTKVSFVVLEEEHTMANKVRIFLSHKGTDKPLVRQFYNLLQQIGLDPWLDEDAMVAGVELERSILKGFQDSCAAVFFITQSFKDEGYLATEVNYAIAEKRQKDNRFAIITIVIPDSSGNKGEVPLLLRPYVWKEMTSPLDACTEILKALPIQPGSSRWKDGI